MSKWFFPSKGFGETERFNNSALETFKGEPIRAMAREVCQNSLDAKLDNEKPLRMEFERHFVNTADFPGIVELRDILHKCRSFWKEKGDEKTKEFIDNAIKIVNSEKLFVLRISDYNTSGLQGAFEEGWITPWKSLVLGNAFSVKNSDSAAGSYGIGKAAPFVVSSLQTVFYRTIDRDGIRAAQGVTHLVSFKDDSANSNEDPVRRSTGYYGTGKKNEPMKSIPLLDRINKRSEQGTDLFIPGFSFALAGNSNWVDEIIIEILDNFLYSIYSGKMEIKIEKKIINRKTIEGNIHNLMPKTKNALAFFNVINENPPVVQEEVKTFHNMGNLKLRVLYNPDGNKKVLVVRNSGMKITDIPSLPKGIAYTGFLELQGEALNKFFRGMENPQHNKWEYKRHSNPALARQYKDEIENWVREYIGEKIKEISGEETDIDVSAYFMTSEKDNTKASEDVKENVIDTVKNIEITQDNPKPKTFRVKDIGGSQGQQTGNRMHRGTIDDSGSGIGHRTRTGSKAGGSPTGRKGTGSEFGDDKLYDTMREVSVSARIIKHGTGANKMIFTAEDNIQKGELEIVTIGENGKPLQLVVKSVKGINIDASVSEGHIVVNNVGSGEKCSVEFEVYAEQTYAMGVRAYGNQK